MYDFFSIFLLRYLYFFTIFFESKLIWFQENYRNTDEHICLTKFLNHEKSRKNVMLKQANLIKNKQNEREKRRFIFNFCSTTDLQFC